MIWFGRKFGVCVWFICGSCWSGGVMVMVFRIRVDWVLGIWLGRFLCVG